jgi:hypothetical protein
VDKSTGSWEESQLPNVIHPISKLFLRITKNYAMKVYGGVDVYIHVFLNSAALHPREKIPLVAIGHEAGCASGTVWTIWRRENHWPYRDSNSDPSVVQPVASRYTNCATAALDVFPYLPNRLSNFNGTW